MDGEIRLALGAVGFWVTFGLFTSKSDIHLCLLSEMETDQICFIMSKYYTGPCGSTLIPVVRIYVSIFIFQ